MCINMKNNNKFNHEIHHRRSIRLSGYDYSQKGFYFITICTKNHKHLFGKINDGEMILNSAGKHTYNCWLEIPEHFPYVQLHEFGVMPNHIQGIIEFVDETSEYLPNLASPIKRTNTGSPQPSPSNTIGSVIRGYKIGITKWFRKNMIEQYPAKSLVLQRNYWEHIIRTELEFGKISQYIIGNPACWEDDKLNGGRGNEVLENQEGYNDEIWMV